MFMLPSYISVFYLVPPLTWVRLFFKRESSVSFFFPSLLPFCFLNMTASLEGFLKKKIFFFCFCTGKSKWCNRSGNENQGNGFSALCSFGEINSPFSVTEKYPEGQYLLSMEHTHRSLVENPQQIFHCKQIQSLRSGYNSLSNVEADSKKAVL